MTASAQGFKAALREHVEVRVGDRLQVDFRLEVGAMTEQVTVTAEAELLETATANKGQVIDSNKVSDLPLLGRNPFMLAAVTAGVQYVPTQASRSNRPFDNGGMDNMQINGGRGLTNELLLDGVPNTNTETGGPANLSFVPSPGLPIAAPGGAFSTGVSPALDNPTRDKWFNTCTLTVAGARQNCADSSVTPAFGIMPAYTLRTLSSYLPGVRTKRAPLTDFSIFKDFTIHESIKVQFRAESFNLTNSVWFAAPNTTVTSTAFGTVSPSQANDPRNVQLALRLVW